MFFRPTQIYSRAPVVHRDSNIVERENLPSETIPLERLSESVSYIFKPHMVTQKTVRNCHKVVPKASVSIQTDLNSTSSSMPEVKSVGVNTDTSTHQQHEHHRHHHHHNSNATLPTVSDGLVEKAKKLKEKQASLEAFLSDIRERNSRDGTDTTDIHLGKVKRMVALTNAKQQLSNTALSPRLNESGVSFRPLMTPSPTKRRD